MLTCLFTLLRKAKSEAYVQGTITCLWFAASAEIAQPPFFCPFSSRQ